MDNEYDNSLYKVTDEFVEAAKFFKSLLVGTKFYPAAEIYQKAYKYRALFELLIDEIMKKSTVEKVLECFSDIYMQIIPYLKEVLQIEGLSFNESFDATKHRVILNLFIDETYYGDLDIFERTYSLPNVERMEAIEKESQKIGAELANIEDEMSVLALQIKDPKKYLKLTEDRATLKYLVGKKRINTNLKERFLAKDNERSLKLQELQNLAIEYGEYQNLILTKRYDEVKLNQRLEERLDIHVDETTAKAFSDEKTEEKDEKDE